MLKIKPVPLPKKIPVVAKKGNVNNLQLRQEFLSAISKYQTALGYGRFSRKSLIYSRPWFLVCGHSGSGKTTLLNKTGLNWITVYPDEPEEQLQWRFASEAVWIDIPGSLLEDSSIDEFKTFLETLAWIRGRRPLDGIVIVNDCGEMLDAELVTIKYQGELLRKRIDQIIKLWGIELPVYHVFSKADKITGFNTIFSDPAGKWNERVLGATLNASIAERSPKDLFLEELSFVLDWVKEIQVKMLARDQDPANRRLICQFPIMFESLRDKISSLVTTLYKKSEHTGRPLFGGFFFTSCQSGDNGLQESDDRIFDVSKTIISHPLNPNKKRMSLPHDSPLGAPPPVTIYFAMPLFTSVIPGHAAPISTTEQKFRQNMVSVVWKIAAALLVIVVFSLFAWRTASNVQSIDKKVRKDFAAPVTRSPEGIEQLYTLLKDYKICKKYAKRRTFSMTVTRYDARNMYEEVKDVFFSAVFSTIVQPCSNQLSNHQSRMVNLSENSPENDFLKLKHLLQTYLAISSSNNRWSAVIDRKVILPVLRNMAVTSIFGVPNVTSGVDTMITAVIGEYITELQINKESKYRVKTDETLVGLVQQKLVTMFDINAVYGMACNELLATSRNMELVDIIGNDVPLNLRSTMALNEVYTPAGWNGNVRKKFNEASRLRENIEDWVIGNYKSTFTGVFNDPHQLYNGLVRRYSEDVKTQWRNFFNAVSMEKFGSFQAGQERLLQLSGAQSDFARLISRFSEWSGAFAAADSGKVNEQAFRTFASDMAFLRQFTGSNLPQYQKQFEDVAKGLGKASEENSILGVFTGRESDPLSGAHNFISSGVLLPLSKDQKGFLEHLLMEPYNRTVDLLKPELARNLTSKWKEISDWFDGSLNRLYPFADNDKEASFEAVIEFFNPVTGTFWKTYNDHFSPYVVKNRSSNFESRNAQGLIPVKFLSAYLRCLEKADTISRTFFKDGKRKFWKITILPQPQQGGNNKKLKNAVITLGKDSIALLTEPGKALKWPIEGDYQKVELNLTDHLDRNGKKLYHSAWGFMRMMNNSCNRSGNIFQSSFTVQMKAPHNAIVQIILPAGVTVSSTDPIHPFCVNPLKGFVVPKVIF
ncbi:MAG TPA: type VI secretion protein IcmF/TssM N-terminal domain-containing protein [Chitinispirillaceae bacterium]|nr:type VI secretion protein IcmF/TssM N-terminal domain-containing protein [Chitinispirillaceae bacterium]